MRGASIGVAVQAAGLGLAFGSSVFLARVLGPVELGRFAYVLSVVAVLAVVAAIGLPTVVARMLPSYEARDSWSLAKGLWRWSNAIIGGIGCLLGFGVMAFGLCSPEPGQQKLLLMAAPIVVVLALTNLRQRTLQGLRHPVYAQLPEQLLKHLLFLLLGGAIWLVGHQWISQAHRMMVLWLLSSTFSLFAGAILLQRLKPRAFRNTEAQYEPRYWLSMALPFLIADALGTFFLNIDTILLGWLGTAEDVGLYQVGLRISALLLVLLGASNWVLAPWFSRLHETGETERLQRIVTRTTRAVFTATSFAYIVMVIAGKPFLALFFGSEFVAAYPVMLILGLGQVINVATGPVVNLLAMTGGQRELALATALVVMLSGGLCVVLIPTLGIVGAAIGVATANAGYNVGLAVLVNRKTHIKASILG